jgi:beta-lactamase class A
MPLVMTRRSLIGHALLTGPVLGWAGSGAAAARDIGPDMLAIERKLGGRLGVSVLDAGTRARTGYRADERFPTSGIPAVLAAALVLTRADRGDDDLERRLLFGGGDLVGFSPVTRERVHGAGMSLLELCEAAVAGGDKSAVNLLLGSFGGPAAATAYIRSLGDEMTRLDRLEPDLNAARAGDPNDTTTPAAILDTFRLLMLGDALSQKSRDRLMAWLAASKSGDGRLKAGFPKGWRVAGVAGSGENGTANDLAIAFPPSGAPVLVAAFLTGSKASSLRLNEALAEIGRRGLAAVR